MRWQARCIFFRFLEMAAPWRRTKSSLVSTMTSRIALPSLFRLHPTSPLGLPHWLALGSLSTGLVTGCGDPGHPDLLGDYHETPCKRDAGVDAGGCGPRLTAPSGGGPIIEFSCLSDEQLEEYDDPLISTVQAFQDDTFYPHLTKPIGGPSAIKTLGRESFSWACTSAEASEPFELLGGSTATEDGGSLRVDPVGHDEFYPTMVRVRRASSSSLPAIPVVGSNELEQIFSTLDVELNPKKGQVLVEVARVEFSADERIRVPGVRISSAGAEAVAYRVGGEWTTDADATTETGLALLINVNSGEDLGIQVDWNYTMTNDPEAVDHKEKVYSITGGITYVALSPPLNAP